MHKKIRESLGLNKLFNLIEARGELCSAVKRHKLAKTQHKLEELKSGYARCAEVIGILKQDSGLQARLEDIFVHLPQLAMSHLLSATQLELHEFFELKSFLWHYAQLRGIFYQQGLGELYPLPDMSALFSRLDPEANNLPSFRISGLYSAKLQVLLDSLQQCSLALKKTRLADLNTARNELGQPGLNEEFVLSRNRQDLIAQLLATPYFMLSGENLANYSFRLADSASALLLKAELQSINAAIHHEQDEIKDMLRLEVQSQARDLQKAWHSCSEMAWDYCLARFALTYGCCIPDLQAVSDVHFPGIKLAGAVNLPLKLFLAEQKHTYQALDIAIEQAANLITGPNMGGKSTALITIGQLCYLASMGIPLPAISATIPLYDEIYYNHDSGENSETLSSFGREVVSLTYALARQGRKLILLDEFAKGTNPTEGEAICLATLKHLMNSPHSLIAATHFSAPLALQGLAKFCIKGIDEASFASLENLPETNLDTRLKLLSAAMDYSLVSMPQATQAPQCAVKIARILGLPAAILEQL